LELTGNETFTKQKEKKKGEGKRRKEKYQKKRINKEESNKEKSCFNNYNNVRTREYIIK